MELNSLIQFQKKINKETFSRYNSWEYCYDVYEDKTRAEDADYLALHLAIYLASWGMYRGSAGLLQKDYKVHLGAIPIIQKYRGLRCDKDKEVSANDIPKILLLIEDLENYYKEISYFDGYDEPRKISPTATLISKIILGTLGCLPAFDELFIAAVKAKNEKFKTLSKPSLNALFAYADSCTELNTVQLELAKLRGGKHYPKFKIIDMYFWEMGYEMGVKKKKEERAKKKLKKMK